MKEISELNIQPNFVNFGISALFKVDGVEYYADLCNVGGEYNECMIFLAQNGQVVNWSDLYCKRGISICSEELKNCINEFVETL